MLSAVHSCDVALLQKLNMGGAHPFLDVFFVYLANFGLMKWPILAAALAFLALGGFREKTLVIVTALAVLFGDAVVSSSIKHLANRPRPYQSMEGLRHVRAEGFQVVAEPSVPGPVVKGRSFPSNHTANNVAFATILTLLYPPWGALAWILALLMAYSRVYTGDHFPTDVLASFPIGIASTLLMCCVASRIWQWLGPRFMPKVARIHPRLFTRVF